MIWRRIYTQIKASIDLIPMEIATLQDLVNESLRLEEQVSILIHLPEDRPGGSVPGDGIEIIIEVSYL